MALGVYGLLGADETIWGYEEDCYSTFRALSAAMAQLTSSNTTDPLTGLWGMNDAAGPWIGSDEQGRRAEFQVVPTVVEHSVGLPLVPFTSTALATVERFGPLALHGLEYYVPLAGAVSAGASIQASKAWFAPTSPEHRTRVRVTIDSGDSPAVQASSEEIASALARVTPYEEDIGASLDPDDEPVDFADPVRWRWWLGDGESHLTTLQATAAGWNAVAISRIAALVVEACRCAGVTEAVGLRIVRATTS